MQNGQIITLPISKYLKIGLLKAAIKKAGLTDAEVGGHEVRGFVPVRGDWGFSAKERAQNHEIMVAGYNNYHILHIFPRSWRSTEADATSLK